MPIIGEGKTSILKRYTNGTFKEEYLTTVGIDYYLKDEILNNKTINVKLWDTEGPEWYKSLTLSYFKNIEGFIVSYDITNTESFDNLKFWIYSIKTNMENKNVFFPVIIKGNKIDMKNQEK